MWSRKHRKLQASAHSIDFKPFEVLVRVHFRPFLGGKHPNSGLGGGGFKMTGVTNKRLGRHVAPDRSGEGTPPTCGAKIDDNGLHERVNLTQSTSKWTSLGPGRPALSWSVFISL